MIIQTYLLTSHESKTDEIKINSPDEPGMARIIAFSDWGIIRGMESFSHLIMLESASNGDTVVG